MRPLRVSRAIAAASAVLVGALALDATPAPAADAPTLGVSANGAEAGQTVLVQGRNWPKGAVVTLEICGNNGSNGSRDCAVSAGTTAAVDGKGNLTGALEIAVPPVPCPCVVRATAAGTPSATAQIRITGAPSGEVTGSPAPTGDILKIHEAALTGRGSWTTWFGAATTRTLVLTVENVSDITVRDPVLTLRSGTSSDPQGVIPSPALGRLAPGQVETYEIPVELDALSIGTYTVKGTITRLNQPVTFSAKTSTYPWGLGVALLVMLQLLLLLVRNRLRARVQRAIAAEAPVEPAALPAPVAEAPAAPAALDAPRDAVSAEAEADEPSVAEAVPEPDRLVAAAADIAWSVRTGAEDAIATHRAAVARMTSDLLITATTEAESLQREIAEQRVIAECEIRAAHDVSSTVLEASSERIDALLVATAEKHAEATSRHAQATRLLEDARERANALLAAAQMAAQDARTSAAHERDEAARILEQARSDADAALADVRAHADAVLEAINARADELLARAEDTVLSVLHDAEAGRRAAHERLDDEVRSFLGAAVERAANSALGSAATEALRRSDPASPPEEALIDLREDEWAADPPVLTATERITDDHDDVAPDPDHEADGNGHDSAAAETDMLGTVIRQAVARALRD